MYFEKSRYIRSVSHTLNADRVVLLDGVDFPDCKFKGCWRQRQKKQLFFCKESCTATFPFLEWLLIKRIQFL